MTEGKEREREREKERIFSRKGKERVSERERGGTEICFSSTALIIFI